MTVLFDGIFSIANKQFDAYKEVMNNIYQNSSEVFKKTSVTNDMFFQKAVKDLEDSKNRLDILAERISLLTDQKAECKNALSLSDTHHDYCALKANEYGTKQFRLQLENDALTKVYNEFYHKVRDVSQKLISYSSDSKALVIPGSKQNLHEYLEMLANHANKQLEDYSQNIVNQKTPIMYESLAIVNEKKKP